MTHLFQILAFMAMEAPTSLEPKPISEEKNKVFRSMAPLEPENVVRGSTVGRAMRFGRMAWVASSSTLWRRPMRVLDSFFAMHIV